MTPLSPPKLGGVFRTDARARAAYAEGAGIYRIVPAAVCVPATVADLQALVRWAGAEGQPLVARGAGSSLAGGAVGAGVVVDLTAIEPRVLQVDPTTTSATTSAGVTLAQLNEAARPHGLRLPPDPSSGAWATLGGMVATNASGARTVRYGSVRRWVQAVRVVTSEGEVASYERRTHEKAKGGNGPDANHLSARPPVRLSAFDTEVAPAIRAAAELIRARFPKTRKNSAGYALDAWLDSEAVVDLFIGSEGTLGFITEIEWRLEPVPAARASLRISLGSLADLGPVTLAINRLDPSAFELLDRSFLDLVSRAGRRVDMPEVPPGTEAMLIVEFERTDARQARGAAGDAVRAVKPWATDVETALTPEEEQRLWTLRHAASPILASLPPDRRSMQVIEDGCVPLERLGEYVGFIRQAALSRGLDLVIFGHAGDGNVHVNLLPELARPGWESRVAELLEVVDAEVIRLGGTVSGEHGVGRLRVGFLERQYGAEVVALFQRVKTAFDPGGILNPGVILGAGTAALSHLKTGGMAEPIPEDIATALREIERAGGYGRRRLEIAGEVRRETGKGNREKGNGNV